MSIKLIAADMDGTLLSSRKQLPKGFFPLVRTLKKIGVRFAPASGRQYYNLYEQFDEIADELMYISENGGMVCDGAKSSCAAKIAAAVECALLGLEMARGEHVFQPGEGLVKDNVEDTIRSVGRMGRDGMKETDIEILNIMLGK